jgi:hypothetical protein
MHYRSIAFGGGGMRGAAHIGALKSIREVQGSLEFPDGIYGSSVGAIVATLVAFRIDIESALPIFSKYHTLSSWIPTPSVKNAWSMMGRKGFYSMERLHQTLVTMFVEIGIPDIESKLICDAPQPLFIVASNMTTKRPTILTGKVPLLQAIMCSSCIPGLFEPQTLYGDVYLDAGVYTRYIQQVVPPQTLCLQIMAGGGKITPESSLGDILYACYVGVPPPRHNSNVCCFKNLKVGVVEDITDKTREEVIEQGRSQALAFLTKVAAKKA